MCCAFEDEARKSSVNTTVTYASNVGARTEGEQGARRLIDHIKGKPHHAAFEAQTLQS